MRRPTEDARASEHQSSLPCVLILQSPGKNISLVTFRTARKPRSSDLSKQTQGRRPSAALTSHSALKRPRPSTARLVMAREGQHPLCFGAVRQLLRSLLGAGPLTAKAQGFDGSTPFHQKRGGLNLENRTIKAVEMSIDSIYAMRDETGKGARSHHPRHVNDLLKALPGPSERALLSASLLNLPALTSCTFCSHGDDDNLCHHHDSQLPLKCRGLVLHYC